jgi:hypothetical protein
MISVEDFLVETIVLQIGFRLSSNLSSIMYLYWEENVTENYHGIKDSLYVADVCYKDFSKSLKNVEGAQGVVANIKFQEEVFILE